MTVVDDALAQQCVVVRPNDLALALTYLASDDYSVVGGGVRYLLDRHDRVPAVTYKLVAVTDIPELGEVTCSDGHVSIGAGLTLSRIASDPMLTEVVPAVAEAAGLVATARIQRIVTLGGNVAACDDAHDPPVALAALGATMSVQSSCESRVLGIADAAGLRRDEIIRTFDIPVKRLRSGSAFEKFLVRGTWEYACVNVAAVVDLTAAGVIDRVRVAVGSVDGGPIVINGDDMTGATVESAIREMGLRASNEASPRDDVRGSARYKTQMIDTFSQRAVARAVRRAVDNSDTDRAKK